MELSSDGAAGSVAVAPGRSAGRATLQVVLSAFGFGAIAIFVTLATGAGAPLLGVLSWRYFVAAVLLAAIGWISGVRRVPLTAVRIVLFAGFAQAVIAALSLSALRYIPAGTLSFLFYTYPAWVAIIARVRHSEPLTPLRLAALGCSLAGIFVMVGAPGGAALHPIGVALAMVSALLYAVYVPLIGELQRDHTGVATSAYISVGAAFFLGLAAVARGDLAVPMNPMALGSIAGLAVISTVAAFLLFLRGLSALGAVRTAIVSTVEPFFTALMAAWLLAQPLTRSTLSGGALIAVAVVLLQLNNGVRGGRVRPRPVG